MDSMKIYTKTGDEGQTGLFGGPRVPKDHLRIEAYGTIDELNSVIGLTLCSNSLPTPLQSDLTQIQAELFQLGAELATPAGKDPGIETVSETQIQRFEQAIDQMEKELPPLTTFILPGGHSSSAWMHLARTISRRAERRLISLHHTETQRAQTLQYLNRLSDYLFVAARYVNLKAGIPDTPWIANHSKTKNS